MKVSGREIIQDEENHGYCVSWKFRPTNGDNNFKPQAYS
jgi:hypothetical protein